MKNSKPLGGKSYGSIGHLPNSRLGVGDHKITEGQARIVTVKVRDKYDRVIIQEKLDGSNVGVVLKDGKILALTRAGYLAKTSPFDMHQKFDKFVKKNEERFRAVLIEGERLCGEWLIQAHGTIYKLSHEPFVVFDMFNKDNKRILYDSFLCRINDDFILPHLVSSEEPHTIEYVMECLGEFGYHNARERIEGAVWRVERKGKVDFLCKYVRPDKVDGKYLKEDTIMNTWVGDI